MSESQAGAVDRLARRAVREAVDERRSFTITKFGRHEDGYFHARVTAGGVTLYVYRKFGSWMAPGHNAKGRNVMKEVLFPIAAELQVKARAIEKAERKEAEAVEAADTL